MSRSLRVPWGDDAGLRDVSPRWLLDSEAAATVEEGTLRDLNFADYEDLYRKWKHNEITSVQAKELGGPGLLDLMEAQWILDTESQNDEGNKGFVPEKETPGTRRGLQE